MSPKPETKRRNHGDGNKVACCCGVEQQKKEELVVPASRCQAANKWIAEKSAEIRYQKKSKVNTNDIPPKSWQKKNFPKENLAQNVPTVTNHSKPKKNTNTLLPFWPSTRPTITISMVLYFGPKTSEKNTSNRRKKPTKSEAFQCPESNAIIDPGTMVIHLQNTGLTWATPEKWSWLPRKLTTKAPEHNPWTRRSLVGNHHFQRRKTLVSGSVHSCLVCWGWWILVTHWLLEPFPLFVFIEKKTKKLSTSQTLQWWHLSGLYLETWANGRKNFQICISKGMVINPIVGIVGIVAIPLIATYFWSHKSTFGNEVDFSW